MDLSARMTQEKSLWNVTRCLAVYVAVIPYLSASYSVSCPGPCGPCCWVGRSVDIARRLHRASPARERTRLCACCVDVWGEASAYIFQWDAIPGRLWCKLAQAACSLFRLRDAGSFVNSVSSLTPSEFALLSFSYSWESCEVTGPRYLAV